MPGWKQDMVALGDYAFGRLRSRLVGLTDDEYFWEPAEGCWTIRDSGGGVYVGDWQTPISPAPFTTIAWRVGHVINNLFDRRYATHLGLEPAGEPPPSLPPTAAAALDLLDNGYAVTRGYLTAVTDTDLHQILGDVAGPWSAEDRGSYVLHMLDELIHHGAEIALLRDLYRANQPPNPVVEHLLAGDGDTIGQLVAAEPEFLSRVLAERADLLLQAAAERRWHAIPLLVELGFPITMPNGTSALHHAAAGGDVTTVDLLLIAGADPRQRDDQYRATPREWAEFFNKDEAAARLRQLDPT